MKRRIEIIASILLLGFCGYIGGLKNAISPSTVNAVSVIPRFTDIPRTNNICLDLNSRTLSVTGNTENTKIEYITKNKEIPAIVVKSRLVPYLVRETPPMRKEHTSLASLTQSEDINKVIIPRLK